MSSQRKVLGNGTDVGLGPRILLDMDMLSRVVIMSSLLDEISLGFTSPKTKIKYSLVSRKIIFHYFCARIVRNFVLRPQLKILSRKLGERTIIRHL